MHGGATGSGAPRGNQNSLQHGHNTAKARQLRRPFDKGSPPIFASWLEDPLIPAAGLDRLELCDAVERLASDLLPGYRHDAAWSAAHSPY